MADLNPCVRRILCSLSSAVLGMLQSLIDSQVALLQAQIVIYQTQLLQYDVLALPVEAARTIAQSYVDKVRRSVYLIPLNAISECVDLGYFNMNLTQSIDVVTAVADDFLSEATRLLSYRDELNEIVQELNTAIEQFTTISNVIGECLAVGA